MKLGGYRFQSSPATGPTACSLDTMHGHPCNHAARSKPLPSVSSQLGLKLLISPLRAREAAQSGPAISLSFSLLSARSRDQLLESRRLGTIAHCHLPSFATSSPPPIFREY